MKYCVLLFVAAVCALVLPSDVGASAVASPSVRAPLQAAKRHLARREEVEVGDFLARCYNAASKLTSDEVAQVLAKHGHTMEELDEAIEADDEIEPEDRPAVKALAIMALLALEEEGELFKDSSEEE